MPSVSTPGSGGSRRTTGRDASLTIAIFCHFLKDYLYFNR
jgi:hypothetical protein